MERVSKINYYLDIAETVAKRSTCLRKHYGAIIVKNDCIVSTGYNGSPRGRKNCSDIQFCMRDKLNIPRGERYEMCRSIHAEANAIISASREEMIGSTLYMSCLDAKTGELVPETSSCAMCKRQVINAGIEKVVARNTLEEYTVTYVRDWIYNDESIPTNTGDK